MIEKIQNKISELIIESSKLERMQIYFEDFTDNNMISIPYAKIILEDSTISSCWENPIHNKKNKIQHKYDVNQSINIIFVDNSKLTVMNNIETLMEKLPRYLILNNQNLEIIPKLVSYRFLKGSLDNYSSILNINIKYGIYSELKNIPLIKNICINSEIGYEND